MKPLKASRVGIILMLGLLVLFLVAIGCGKGSEQTGNGDAGEEIVVTDGLGRKITLSKPAERVTTYGIDTITVFARSPGQSRRL